MKSIKFYLSVALFTLASTASAQFVNSGNNAQGTSSSMGTTHNTDLSGWNRVSLSVNPMSLSTDIKGMDGFNLTGFSLGYAKGISISKQVPLFFEAGINAQFAFKTLDSEGMEDAGLDEDGFLKCKFTTMNLNVPLNLAYKFNVGNVSLVPYAGINLKLNLLGKMKYNLEDPDEYLSDGYFPDGYDEDDFWKDMEDDYDVKQTVNMFDKKEVGDKDFTWKRFQMGWQVGVGLNYNKLHVGVGYTKDFIELYKKSKIGYASITLGYNF